MNEAVEYRNSFSGKVKFGWPDLGRCRFLNIFSSRKKVTVLVGAALDMFNGATGRNDEAIVKLDPGLE